MLFFCSGVYCATSLEGVAAGGKTVLWNVDDLRVAAHITMNQLYLIWTGPNEQTVIDQLVHMKRLQLGTSR